MALSSWTNVPGPPTGALSRGDRTLSERVRITAAAEKNRQV